MKLVQHIIVKHKKVHNKKSATSEGKIWKKRISLGVVMPKMSEYVRFVDDNKSMSFHVDDDKLLEKYKNIWRRTEQFKGVGLTILPVHDDKYIKTKTKTNKY